MDPIEITTHTASHEVAFRGNHRQLARTPRFRRNLGLEVDKTPSS